MGRNPEELMKKLSKKAVEAKVSAAYKKVGNCVVVPIMSLGKILNAGRKVAEAGGDDAAIEAAMAEVINQVKVA
jgi:hypothetical protein